MEPYEALYEKKCIRPLCYDEVRDKGILGPNIIQETIEKIKMIQENMKKAQERKKSCTNQRRSPLEFEEENHVFLKVTPKLGLKRLYKERKKETRKGCS